MSISTNKDHQMLNRKRYSPPESNESESNSFNFNSFAGEHKKEEGELTGGNTRLSNMSYNQGDRNEKYYKKPHYQNYNKPQRYDRGERNQRNERNDYYSKDERYTKPYQPRKMNPNPRYDSYSRREGGDFRRGSDDYRAKDHHHREKTTEDNYRRPVRRDSGRKYTNEEGRPYQGKSDRDYSYNNVDSYQRSDSHSDERSQMAPTMKKKFNFLIVLPKNYFRFIEKEYNYIYSEIKKRVRDIDVFQYDHKIPHFGDFLLRIDAAKVSAKAYAMKIVCDVLFDCMKETYENMTYLKTSILVPNHVVGFIIGIEGKNINTIRDISGARIDVFQHDVAYKYRQIELQGSPDEISKAAEKIYKIVNKYYFFNNVRDGSEEKSRKESFDPKRKKVRLGGKTQRRDKRRYSHSRSRSNSNNKKMTTLDREKRPEPENTNKLASSGFNAKEISNFNNSQVQKEKSRSLTPEKIEPAVNKVKEEIPEIISQPINVPVITPQPTTVAPTSQLIPENFSSVFPSNISIDNTQDEHKLPLNIVITNQHLNMLKNIRGNIFIEIENKFHCSISKKVEKLSNSEVNILTLSGTPEQNCMAIYSLQQAMMGKSDIFKN